MTAIRDRLKRSREQTPQPAQPEPPASMRAEIHRQQARREQDREILFARLARHCNGYDRCLTRYGNPPAFRTSYEARADELWQVGYALGLLLPDEYPTWIRKEAGSAV